ncbi:MAG: pilus assembly protein PilM [Candidatus Omnitrophica bacterium]|nr:pilus assembly protein PilM [Candidatus Omnitrophota bacterium]
MVDSLKESQIKKNQLIDLSKLKLSPEKILSSIKSFFASTQNVIGLDIGSSHIKIVQLQKIRTGYVITNYITRAIPSTAKDTFQQKRRFVREFVKQFIADARVKTTLGRTAISGKGVFILSLIIPALSKKDLRGAVSIELKKRLPFQTDLSNVFFDFFVTDEIHDEGGGVNLQVTCIACDRFVLDEQVQLLKEMGLRPRSINVIPDAIGNLLPYCLEITPDKTTVVLDIGASCSLLNFYKGNALQFSREIPVAGEHLTRALTKTITTSLGTVNILAEDAEKIKRQCGIPLDDDAQTQYLTDFGVILGNQLSSLLRPTLERLVTEINRTISFYIKTFKSEPIEELYLTGGSARLKNLDKFLLYNLEGLKKVEILNTLQALKGWQDTSVFKQEMVMEQVASHMAVSFGLCLGNGGKVNLLPLKERVEQKVIFATTLLRIVFPLLLTFSLSFYGLAYANALRYKIWLSKLEAEINRLEPIASKAREYVLTKTKLEQRKELIKKAEGRQPIWWGILKELSNITPNDVILNRIAIPQKKEPRQIHLEGKIFARYTIVDLALSQYLMALEESPFFKHAQLVTSKKDMYSSIPAANFEIICELNY